MNKSLSGINEENYILQKLQHNMFGIVLSDDKAEQLKSLFGKRVLCKINNKEIIHAAINRTIQIGHFIYIGRKTCKSLNIKEGELIKIIFERDESTYQFEYPEVLKEVLESDMEANEVFMNLSAGNQRGLIYLITQVKSIDKQIERALKIADNIKIGITSPRDVLKK